MTAYSGVPADAPASSRMPYPMARVSAWRNTSLGPVALRSEVLPDGWTRDEFGALHRVYGGVTYKITDGKVYRQTGATTTAYPGTGQGIYNFGTGGSTQPVWQEAPADELPVEVRKMWRTDKVTGKEALDAAPEQATGGPSSAFGKGWDNRPAGMGGPLNSDNWLGSEWARDAGWSEDQIRSYTVKSAVKQRQDQDIVDQSRSLPPTQAGYYQRASMVRAVKKGYGRPQYQPSDLAVLPMMDPQQLINIQASMMKAGIPGASSITIGAPRDPATETAYEYVLTQANLWGVTAQDAIERLAFYNRAGQNLTADGTAPGAQKFDPVKTRTTVNLTGKARARAQLRDMMSQMLGRMPSNSEVDDYLNKLNAAERADPAVTTYNYQRDGDVTQTTEQSDVDPIHIAESDIKKGNPREYRAMQETNYFNALLDMIGG